MGIWMGDVCTYSIEKMAWKYNSYFPGHFEGNIVV